VEPIRKGKGIKKTKHFRGLKRKEQEALDIQEGRNGERAYEVFRELVSKKELRNRQRGIFKKRKADLYSLIGQKKRRGGGGGGTPCPRGERRGG